MNDVKFLGVLPKGEWTHTMFGDVLVATCDGHLPRIIFNGEMYILQGDGAFVEWNVSDGVQQAPA